MGPLAGVRIVEIAGIGPGPFCGMLLADLGAEVLRVDRTRPGGLQVADPKLDLLNRGKRSVAVDLKAEGGADVVLRLVERADALIEGFRPGVAERLGVGPDACAARNPRLVYGRMTGWGQDGPLARAAGHDLNYIALAGAASLVGRPGDKPAVPLNLIGDFGGGGLYLALGVVAAILEARASGRGQVVDAAIVDGTASLLTAFHGLARQGLWGAGRGRNLLDGGAPFYDVYETKDGKYVSVAALEPQFYAELVARLDLPEDLFQPQLDPARFPERRRFLESRFREKTRDEWVTLLEGTEVCFAPVLELGEVGDHPHNRARGLHVEVDGVPMPAPAPRFSRTAPDTPTAPPTPGEHTRDALAAWGFGDDEIADLEGRGVVR